MKMIAKAKAAVAGIVVVAVAGTAGAVLYLNNNGKLGNENPSEGNSIIIGDTEDGYRNYNNNNININNNDRTTEKNETNTAPAAETTVSDKHDNNDKDNNNFDDYVGVNEFLSEFSKVSFGEEHRYSSDNRNDYDLIRFALAHIRLTDSSAVTLTEENDNIRYYNGVSADKVNDVLTDYFGVTVKCESVYTENDYMFFRYKDGMFYTPATDGAVISNITVCDNIKKSGSLLTVNFTVYSSGTDFNMTAEEAKNKGEKYKSGSATVKITDGGYILEEYKIS